MPTSRSTWWYGLALSALLLAAAVAPAAATQGCAQVQHLLAQGYSVDEIAGAFGAPVGAVQACLSAAAPLAPAGRAPIGAAGPAPIGAAGPAPIGAAGPAPWGAAGPAPIGAAGPAPIGAAGPAPIGPPSKPNAIKR